MTSIRLGYDPTRKYNWRPLRKDTEEYTSKEYNGKFVIKINVKLWQLIKVVMDMKRKGWDSPILIDGKRRSGKSTMAQIIAYILNPDLTINNFVAGIDEAPTKIDEAKDEDVLIFDEGSLVANSKDAMSKQSKQLHKIIDTIGVKKLTLIFCLPNFLNLSRPLVLDHAMFLIRIGVRKSDLKRGRFKVYKNEKMKRLYSLSKKDPKLAKKVSYSFNGSYPDFHLPFEEQYFELKKRSRDEAINPELKKVDKPPTKREIMNELMMKFKENCPDITDKMISKGFGISLRQYYRIRKTYSSMTGD